MKEIAIKAPHGGKRPGAGKPRTPIDERRVLILIAQKVSQREIAVRFGVTLGVIQYFARTYRQKQALSHADRAQAAINKGAFEYDNTKQARAA